MFKGYFPRDLGSSQAEQDQIQKIEPTLVYFNAYKK
jgi:hypothetical protein